ncbi:MAG: glycosyltransferase family 87 protein, partial [Pseudomonadota bacterium]
PYAVAYPLFVVLGIAAFAVAGALTAPRQAATTRRWTAALLAGGALMLFAQVYSGQLTLIWTAALVTALALHDRGHPVAAGLMIGLCSIKPPLCLLLPIAVIATGDRRFVAAATASVTLLAVVPTLWTGIGYWQDWIAALATQSDRVGNDVTSIRGMLSWYAVLRGLGLDQPAAVGLHALVTLGAAVAVWTVWRRPGVPFAARAGLLLIAVPLASPYAWYYELAIVLAGMLFLIGAGWGRGPIAWVLFVIVWALGGFLPFLAHPVEFRYIMAPAVTLAFLAALSQTGMLGRRVERVLG